MLTDVHPERWRHVKRFEGAFDQPAQVTREYVLELDLSKDFRDIFLIVKKSVKAVLGMKRVGLILYLADLPLQVGAYHGVGTNAIVVNRALLEVVEKAADSKREVNAFVYSILLHEYLHSLGFLNEHEVRDLTYRVTREVFGERHIATGMAALGPWAYFGRLPQLSRKIYNRGTEVIRDFEEPDQRYIS